MKSPWVALKVILASLLVNQASTPQIITCLLNPVVFAPMIDMVYQPGVEAEELQIVCPMETGASREATINKLALHTVAYFTMSLLPQYLVQHYFLDSLLFPVIRLVVSGGSSYLFRSGLLEMLGVYWVGSYI